MTELTFDEPLATVASHYNTEVPSGACVSGITGIKGMVS